MPLKESVGELTVGKHLIKTSHEDRVLFPRDGITKGDVIEYYRRIAPAMVPHLKGRRLTLERFHEDIDHDGIFQKEVSGHFPDWIHRVTVPKHRGTVTHVVCDDAATLVYLANQGCLTPHVSLSRLPRLDFPDQLVFDLDPAGDDFEPVRTAAFQLKEMLDEIRLASFVKTSGSRGLHVVIPLNQKLEFDPARSIARQIAAILVARHPATLTIEQLKVNRNGRLFIDTNRNGAAQTVVPAFAVRARDGAPVSMPIDWSELKDASLTARSFTIANAYERTTSKSDAPWAGMARSAKSLAGSLRRLDDLRAAAH
jgi:bifunctional non-homologous end joining protein LigD